jgi:hypothetical protein
MKLFCAKRVGCVDKNQRLKENSEFQKNISWFKFHLGWPNIVNGLRMKNIDGVGKMKTSEIFLWSRLFLQNMRCQRTSKSLKRRGCFKLLDIQQLRERTT